MSELVLICEKCGGRVACSDDDANRYLRNGWPACCGYTMTLTRRSGAQVDGTAVLGGEEGR